MTQTRLLSRAAVLLTRLALAAWLVTTMVASSGCASVLNRDPNLRWWAFKTFGADRICPEMLKASVPLKMQDGAPTIGRYFPSSCSYSINEQNRTVLVNIGGNGYAYLPTIKRSGFTLNVSVEYAFDFYMHDEGAWVWGKMARIAAGPDFKMTNSENKVIDIATVMTPAGSAANLFGGQVVTGFVSRGFTVIETDNGSKEFSLGILPPGKHPFRPVMVDSDDEAYTFQNDTADIYTNQQDFIGPLEVADDDQVIQLKGTLNGPNAVDLIVVNKMTGESWRQAYQAGAPAGPPPGPALTGAMVQPGPFLRKFNVPPGFYYVVVDNSAAAGQASPAAGLPVFDTSVRMTYLAQLVEE